MPRLVPTGKNASELLKSYYVIAKRNSRKVLEVGRRDVSSNLVKIRSNNCKAKKSSIARRLRIGLVHGELERKRIRS